MKSIDSQEHRSAIKLELHETIKLLESHFYCLHVVLYRELPDVVSCSLTDIMRCLQICLICKTKYFGGNSA